MSVPPTSIPQYAPRPPASIAASSRSFSETPDAGASRGGAGEWSLISRTSIPNGGRLMLPQSLRAMFKTFFRPGVAVNAARQPSASLRGSSAERSR